MFEFDYNGRKTTCMDKVELQDGKYYRGHCRNAIADLARWDGPRQQFVYIRSKTGFMYTEVINHPQDEEHYDVFCVDELVENPEFVIPTDDDELDKAQIHAAAEKYYKEQNDKRILERTMASNKGAVDSKEGPG